MWNDWVLGTFVGIAISGTVGAAIGSPKGRIVAAFWLGVLLGPIGWLIAAYLKPSEDRQREIVEEQEHAIVAAEAAAAAGIPPGLWACPHCAELVQPEATVCHACGRDVTQ